MKDTFMTDSQIKMMSFFTIRNLTNHLNQVKNCLNFITDLITAEKSDKFALFRRLNMQYSLSIKPTHQIKRNFLGFKVNSLVVCFIFVISLSLGSLTQLNAQSAGPLPERFQIFSQNSISNIGAFGDTLWVGPQLVRNINNSFDWFVADADSVTSGRGRLYSIALAQDTVFAGLGYITTTGDDNVQTAQGFYVSTDGGDTWRFINPPLDPVEMTSIRYGGQDIEALAIVVPQQAPPFNVAFRGDVMFTASWALGIRRSLDFGYNWERILLPPFELDRLVPEDNYDFAFNPRSPVADSDMGRRFPNGWTNFLGFSVMIDSDGYVWAGTAGGLNISENALRAPADSIRWRHVRSRGGLTGMLGNWVIRIRQNPVDNKVWMTNWVTFTGERRGLVASSDKGLTFDQYLVNEDILDVTFNGSTIYAAGRNALFVSKDNGATWIKQGQIRSNNSFLKSDVSFQSAAKTSDRVWIGTTDGLISTADDGISWEITRVDFPMSGENIFQVDAPSTDTYAYPNPFSRTQNGIIRIRFKTDQSGTAKVEIRDFAMERVIRLPDIQIGSSGVYEIAWDGLDALGRKVSNGPVFYNVTIGNEEYNGKFLILE